MALSGSFSSYPVGKFGLYCTWEATQNIPGYYSNVTVKVYVQHYSIEVGSRRDSTIKCVGSPLPKITAVYIAKALSFPSGTPLTKTLIGSYTFKVDHDRDKAEKSLSLSATWDFNGTYSGTYVGTITAHTEISLDAIPQQSVISSVSVDSNNKVTVNLTRYVDTFTHVVKFTLGSYSYTSTNVGTSTYYTVPLEWFNAIPNNVEGTGTVQVTTYSGSSPIGVTVNKEFTVNVPSTVVPSISGISWTKTSSEPSSWPITKDVSTGTMAMTGVKGAYGSTITSYSLTFAGFSSNAATLTVSRVTTVGTLDAVAKVTDSRGRSFTKTVSFTVADYAKPTLEVVAYRSDNTGAENAMGDNLFVKATAEITAIGNNLLDTLMLYYKKTTDSSWEGYELSSGDENILSASSDFAWEWRVVAGDFASSVEIKGSIPTGEVVFDILANGKGIKFGGVAEAEGFDSAWPFMFNGVPQADFVVEQGKSGIWTYRKWNSGISECWGEGELTIGGWNVWGSLFESDTTYQASYPSGLFVSVPMAYAAVSRILESSNIGTCGLEVFSGASSTQTPTYYALRPGQGAKGTIYLSLMARGRWK
jgi:hypothetical protein